MNAFFKLIACLGFALFCTQCSQNYSVENQASASLNTKLEAPKEYGELLAKYVKLNGVQYNKWYDSKEDLAKLEKVVQFYAQQKAPESRDASLAWHLNAYNAWTLNEILEAWPTKGPFDVSPLFFHGKRIRVGGKKMSFQHLENKIIRPKFQESRIHFALNCASRSCPPLHNKPFRAFGLDETLERLTYKFLNENSLALEESGEQVKVSRIFKWYKEDFGGEEGTISYINKFRNKKLSNSLKLSYLKYDWTVNQAL